MTVSFSFFNFAGGRSMTVFLLGRFFWLHGGVLGFFQEDIMRLSTSCYRCTFCDE